LAAAAGKNDQKLTVASATTIAEGRVALIDGEFVRVTKAYVSGETSVPVARGQQGTAAEAHPITAEFTHGAPEDWAQGPPGSLVPLGPSPVVRRVSYSASGAIAHPEVPGETRYVTLNGTSVLAMTLAVPDEAINGARLFIYADGAASHTVTAAGGFGGAGGSYDVFTFNGTGTAGVEVVASGALWLVVGQVTGTLTNIAVASA
jgi:hypothetical protein